MVAEHERHVEHVDVRDHRSEGAEADAGHLYRAELHLLDHFLFRAENTAGEHAVIQFALGGFGDLLAHVLLRDHRGVAGRVDLGNLQRHGMCQPADAEGEG